MEILDRTKTPQGRIPVSGVRRAEDEQGIWLEFVPDSLFDGSRVDDKSTREVKIEDIAFLGKEGLLPLAKQTGPLFGHSLRESVFDWQSAVNIAHDVLVVQEVANGVKSVEALATSEPDGLSCLVAKTTVKNAATKDEFVIFAISFAVDSQIERGYVSQMPELPWLKRFAGAGVDYAIANLEQGPSMDYLTVTLLSFKHEISLADFTAVISCYYDKKQAERLTARANAVVGDSSEFDNTAKSALATNQARLIAKEDSIGAEDAPHLQRLVQAVISLHLQGVSIDLFQSTEDDDFLSFDTYLSYLWFGFSRRLGKVKIGYCPQCGRAFSLAGHRGIPKKFCSDACKTAAKNERVRQTQGEIRQAFLSGESVEELAAQFYPGQAKGAARKRVRETLSRWVELKRLVREDILNGPGELTKRCVAEQIFEEERVTRRAKTMKQRAGD